jgi:DNA-binding IclR family transcriptional regulator
MSAGALKTPPTYAITSVDHALVLASALQLEGELTVTAAAERLGVARSTAHRVLQMLVYRDFAVQDEDRVYRPGLVMDIVAHPTSRAAELRTAALPHLRRLSVAFGESVNLSIRVGDTTRFIASIECEQPIRVTSREGMVFPLHRTTTGMLFLASLPDHEVQSYVDRHRHGHREGRWNGGRDVARVRRTGFALNVNRSETGLVAIGVTVPSDGGELFAGLSVSMPTTRYDERRVDRYVAALRSAVADLTRDQGPDPDRQVTARRGRACRASAHSTG